MYDSEKEANEEYLDYMAAVGLNQMVDGIADVTKMGAGAILSWKQKEEFQKKRQEELLKEGKISPEEIKSTSAKIVEPVLKKPEKGKEGKWLIDTSVEVVKFVVSIAFAVFSLFGDLLYAIYKKFVEAVVNHNSYY